MNLKIVAPAVYLGIGAAFLAYAEARYRKVVPSSAPGVPATADAYTIADKARIVLLWPVGAYTAVSAMLKPKT